MRKIYIENEGIERRIMKKKIIRLVGVLVLLLAIVRPEAGATIPEDPAGCGYWDGDNWVPYQGNECVVADHGGEHFSCNADCECICDDDPYYTVGTAITQVSITTPADGAAFPVGQNVSFSCSSCSDSDIWHRCEGGEWKETSVDDTVSYEWLGSGQTGTGTSFTLVSPAAGTHNVAVCVSDSPLADDDHSMDSVNVHIVEVSSLTADKTGEVIGDFVTFTATTYPAGHEYMISWSGGGSPASQTGGATFVTRWPGPGTYTVRAECGTSTKTREIVIGPSSEYSIAAGHDLNMAEFIGQLTPQVTSIDYSGHSVGESSGGIGSDGCHFPSSWYPEWKELIPWPDQWALHASGGYGIDYIGWWSERIWYYRASGRTLPCNNSVPQDMSIDTTYGLYKYKTNILQAYIGTTTLKSIRDGVPEGWWVWP